MTVSVPAEDDESLLEVIAAHGAPVEAYRGRLGGGEGTLPGQVFRSNRSAGADNPSEATGIDRDTATAQGIGPFLLVPINTSHGVGGVLGVVRQAGRVPFNPEEVRVVESFGQQAGLAIDLDRAQTDREQLALIGDRERIARDLHDHVIQRLFAVGMSLQSASHSITDQTVLERIGESVEELDATIRDVRSTIFSLSLRATEKGDSSARARILDVASAAVPALGFQPRLQFDGPVDTKVAEELVPDILAVVREALSNTARHAHASRVDVRVDAHDDLVITITDDGDGIGEITRTSGLANLQARAETRGGTMTVGRGDDHGTRLCWRVPFGD
jgi:signal transduction histidine kinase